MNRSQRSYGSLITSLLVHVVGGAAIAWVLTLPYPVSRLFRGGPSAKAPPVERISFVRLPRGPSMEAGKSGGDGAPPRRLPPLRAPTPAPPARPVPAVAAPLGPGSGPIVGEGGPARGVRPAYADPRLWVPPADVVTAPTTVTQRLDSLLAARIGPITDSLAQVAAAARKGSDWTFERNGKKYGLDQQGLHIGDFTVPRFLLPTFQQPNALYLERDRQIALMRREIQENAQRALNEDEFRKAVRAIRERKERERERARSEPKRDDVAGAGRR
ncbi:MAG: hypothetical protein NVS4B3_13100 [Gemmatimonadaceae bacterium]